MTERAHRADVGVPFVFPVLPSSRLRVPRGTIRDSHPPTSTMHLVRHSALALALALAAPLGAQTTGDPSRLTVERIFASPDFRGGSIPQPAWLSSGSSYIVPRPAKDGGTELVKVDIATGGE